MATASAPSTSSFTASELSDIIDCPICYTVYNKPLQLSCGHTLCSTCIDKLVENARAPANPALLAPFLPPGMDPDRGWQLDIMPDLRLHGHPPPPGPMGPGPNNEPIFAGGGGPMRGALPFGPIMRNGPIMLGQQRVRQHRRGGGTEIKCPECRKPTIVPPDGLPVNYRVQDVVAKMTASSATQVKTEPQLQQSCKVCEEALNQGVYFDCVTCGDDGSKLCPTCAIRTHNGHDIVEKRALTDRDVKAMKDKINENAGIAFRAIDELQPKLSDLSQVVNNGIIKILQDTMLCFERMASSFDDRINPSSTIDELQTEVEKAEKMTAIYREAVEKCDQCLASRIKSIVDEYLLPLRNLKVELGIGLLEGENQEVAPEVGAEEEVAAAALAEPPEPDFAEVQMDVDIEPPRQEEAGHGRGFPEVMHYMMMRDRLRERQRNQLIPPPPQQPPNNNANGQRQNAPPNLEPNQVQQPGQQQPHPHPQNMQMAMMWNEMQYRPRNMRGPGGAAGPNGQMVMPPYMQMHQQQQHMHMQQRMMGIAQPPERQQQLQPQAQQNPGPQQQNQGPQRFVNPIYNVNYLPNHQGEIVLEMRMRPYPQQQQQQQQQQPQQPQQQQMMPPGNGQNAGYVIGRAAAAIGRRRNEPGFPAQAPPFPINIPQPPPQPAGPRQPPVQGAVQAEQVAGGAMENERRNRRDNFDILNRQLNGAGDAAGGDVERPQELVMDLFQDVVGAVVQEELAREDDLPPREGVLPRREGRLPGEEAEDEITPRGSPNREEEEDDPALALTAGAGTRVFRRATRHAANNDEPSTSTGTTTRKHGRSDALERAKKLMSTISISPSRQTDSNPEDPSTSSARTRGGNFSNNTFVSKRPRRCKEQDDQPSTSTAPSSSSSGFLVPKQEPDEAVEQDDAQEEDDEQPSNKRTRLRRSTVYRRGRFNSPSGSSTSSNTSTETHAPQRTRSNRTIREASP